MQQITQLLGYPDGTPVDAVQAKMSAVYERRIVSTKYGDKSVQSAELMDIGGNKIRITAWEHPDLTPMKDKDIVLHSGAKGGVKLKHGTYTAQKGPNAGKTIKTIELDVGKAAQFQFVEVYKQTNPTAEVPNTANPSPLAAVIPIREGLDTGGNVRSGPSPINGAKVGMALNNAVLLHTNAGLPCDTKSLAKTASDIIRLSNWLESGNLIPKDSELGDERKPDAPPAVERDGGGDEDVPY